MRTFAYMQINTMRGYTASECIRGFSLVFNPSSVSVFWWSPTEFTRAHCCFAHRLSAVFVEWMQQWEGQIWDSKQAIFRPLWWDLWTSDWRTGKQVILALADHDLKRVQPLLGNIFNWLSQYNGPFWASQPCIFFFSGTPPSALTHWKRFKTASNIGIQQRKDRKAR